MKIQPPRGTRDFLPEEMNRRRKAFDSIRNVFELYGYGEVCTPAFEDFKLLSKKSGPDIEKEIYTFKDKNGRKLGLRFDPTVPICRIVASNLSLAKPIKFYYITNMWRYDRPSVARWREFWQCGAELIGSDRADADAEVLSLVFKSLNAIGIKNFCFKINSRKIVNGILQLFDIKKPLWPDYMRILDKLDKIGAKAVFKEFEKLGLKKEQYISAENILRNSISIEELKKYIIGVYKNKNKNPEENDAMGGFSELERIIKLAKLFGVRNIEFDASIVRGIDYYTGFVFETFVKGYENFGSVASGGRYNDLIKIYSGRETPATGFGIGIDRLMEILKDEEYSPVKIFVAPVNEETRREAIIIVQILRKNNIKADTDLIGKKLGKQMKYVNAMNIPYTIIMGTKELGRGEVLLRDMKTGKEKRIKNEKIVDVAKSL
ncbi:MAG: histidine--tRNA ligase [Candidatus Aenigmarchaeota archaeon]|nr:histidine--tRNA ligase [Candidatus Aenigmarchaeota archaeon]